MSRHSSPTTVPAYRPLPSPSQGSACGRASVSACTQLYYQEGIDYPISGDETLRAYGYVGIRQRHINLWHSVELQGIFIQLDEFVDSITDTCELCGTYSDSIYGEIESGELACSECAH